MKSSRLFLTIAIIAFICITGINGQRARPTVGGAASAPSTASARLPARNSQPVQQAAPSVPATSDGRHDEPEEFTIADLAGTHAFKASGVVLVGGVGSPTFYPPGSATEIPTYPEDLWVSMEGRICINEKGECSVNAWVNVGGHTSIHLDTQDPAKCQPAGQQCRATVDEFGQGVVYVPIVLTPDEEATTIMPNFPSFFVLKFQAFDGDHTYFEVEGCGPKGTIQYSGAGFGLAGFDAATNPYPDPELLQYIRHVCTPSEVAATGRRPISLTGESSRITFRCSNCKKDDFAWYGGDCSDICPWDDKHSGGGGPGGFGAGGPRGGRNNGGYHSLDV